MKYEVKFTSHFKKDYKLAQKRGLDMSFFIISDFGEHSLRVSLQNAMIHEGTSNCFWNVLVRNYLP